MCGIFGVIETSNKSTRTKNISEKINLLARLSESRGKDSSGLAVKDDSVNALKVLKGALPVSDLLKHNTYKDIVSPIIIEYDKNVVNKTFLAFGHSRLVTNGTQLNEVNNQPVIRDNIAAVHNGIIINGEKLWKSDNTLERKYEIDTEVLIALISKEISSGKSTIEAYNKVVDSVFGTIATAIYLADRNELLLATNNGSLYVVTDYKTYLYFASERHILNQFIKSFPQISEEIKQVRPNNGFLVSLEGLEIIHFNSTSLGFDKKYDHSNQFTIDVFPLENGSFQRNVVVDIDKIQNQSNASREENILEYNIESIKNIRRCTKCILPETFPFISFDDKGVCNYCNNYVLKNAPKPISELKSLIEPYRSKSGDPDVIVPLSGGRDSSFVLHMVKTELGMNPIAFTYDWGMVTDLARRNISRVCSKLGVENIIVAADIHRKREYIRKNVLAWLRNPHLGMIPLFMAGDKYFFYYCNKVKKQTGINLNIWGVNNLENTEFKTGFAGLSPNFDKKRIYSLSVTKQLKLFGFVAKNLIGTPQYLNSSIFDTLGSFASRYVAPKSDYYHFYDYYRWDECEIESIIIKEYDWETSNDSVTTWRIGDGTASFYNYIFYTVAGFSEHDTFRSNMIREGMLDRNTALKICEKENRPRYVSIKWYLEILGLDYEFVIKSINQMPKLYQ